jgi:membrane-bound lytic murein transglycosylase D
MSAWTAIALLQIALTAGWLAARVLAHADLTPRAQLLAHRGLLLLALAAPLLVTPVQAPWTPPAALRTAATAAHAPLVVAVALPGPTPTAELAVPAAAIQAGTALLALILALGLGRFLWAGVALRRRLGRAQKWRTIGGVDVRIDPLADAPFAARTPWHAVVVLDPKTAADPVSRPLALRHELQHHRHADPLFAWLWLAVRSVLGWNPAIRAWYRLTAEIEEQACDAAVIAHPRVSPRAYGQLLLSVVARPPAPAGATGLPPRSPLHQRLSMLARPTTPRPVRAIALSAGAAALLLVTTGAARNIAQDQRLDAVNLGASPALPAALHAEHSVVQSSLANFQGKHAKFIADGLERRSTWAPLVDSALADAHMPAWLAAIPLVESGYTNWGAPGEDRVGSAAPGQIPGRGLWMFIAPTARTYGLTVDESDDERLDPELETEAAVALLQDLHTEFGDWRLALAGYNQGPRAVRKAIRDGESRDPWVLIEGGWLNDYAADVVAAGAILRAER